MVKSITDCMYSVYSFILGSFSFDMFFLSEKMFWETCWENWSQLNYVISLSLGQPPSSSCHFRWKLIFLWSSNVFLCLDFDVYIHLISHMDGRIFIVWERKGFISYSEIQSERGVPRKGEGEEFTGSWGVSCPKNCSLKLSKKFWVSRNARGGVGSKLPSHKIEMSAYKKQNKNSNIILHKSSCQVH